MHHNHKGHTVKRLLLIPIAAVLLALLALPAAAQRDGDRAADARPADARPTDVRPEPTPEPKHEVLRLVCVGRMTDDGRAAVACEWSPAQSDRAAGYVLERVSESADPIVVLATRDLGVTSYIDADIRVGVLYGYRVSVLNANGQIIGGSEWERADVDEPTVEPEVLTLDCDGRIVEGDDGRIKVGACEWRSATHPDAVGYQLWRILGPGDDARELVHRGGLDVTSHVERLPSSTLTATYAVLAVDADGELVGRSRPQTVTFPHDGDSDIRPVDIRPIDVRRALVARLALR